MTNPNVMDSGGMSYHMAMAIGRDTCAGHVEQS